LIQLNKEEYIGISCHDAGGAEIISSYVIKHSQYKFLFNLSGPSIQIFKKKKIKLKNNLNKKNFYEKSNIFLCGSSSLSDHELKTIKKSKLLKKKCIVFLDHWVNYGERFIRNKVRCLPDEIWVGDKYAQKKAFKIFGKKIVHLKINPYFQQLSKIKKNNNSTKIKYDILYLTEPISSQYKKKLGYNEIDCFKNFLQNINLFTDSIKLKIRLHPSENNILKYTNLITDKNIKIFHDKTSILLNDILSSKNIVGAETNAMVVAIKLKKNVYSAIPYKFKCRLPFKLIKRFNYRDN